MLGLQKHPQLKKSPDKAIIREGVLTSIVYHTLYSRYIDPTAQQEKNAIKETIARMAEDKDKELASAAQSTLESLKEVDRDY